MKKSIEQVYRIALNDSLDDLSEVDVVAKDFETALYKVKEWYKDEHEEELNVIDIESVKLQIFSVFV